MEESLSDKCIREIESIKRASDNVEIGENADRVIDSIKKARYSPPEEEMNKQISDVGDALCAAIKAMSSKDVSRWNVDDYFKRYPRLRIHADGCVDTIESKGMDSRRLVNAFRKMVCDKEFFTHEEMDNGFVIDLPHDQIIAAMDWMTELATEHSPCWVDDVCSVPIEALMTPDSFKIFVEDFSTKKELKKCFNELKLLAKKHKEETTRFKLLCEEYYDTNVASLMNNDRIVDTLEHGTQYMLFGEFDDRIQQQPL